MGPKIEISVIVPHLNQPEDLARCLASLAAQARQPDEVVVVDNGSPNLPESVCAMYPNVRLLLETTPGPGPARNLGVRVARGDILAFIDADCLADSNWLATAEQELLDLEANILGGDVRIAYAKPSRITSLEAYESIYSYRMDRYIEREGFTGTGNLVVQKEVMERVGPFAGISVAEDRDWGHRATGQGYRIRYVAGMRVYHPARRQFAQLKAKWDRHIAHDFVAAREVPFGRARFFFKALVMTLSPFGEIPRVLTSDRISGFGVRLRAFVALVRIRSYRAWVMVQLLCGRNPLYFSGRWNRS